MYCKNIWTWIYLVEQIRTFHWSGTEGTIRFFLCFSLLIRPWLTVQDWFAPRVVSRRVSVFALTSRPATVWSGTRPYVGSSQPINPDHPGHTFSRRKATVAPKRAQATKNCPIGNLMSRVGRPKDQYDLLNLHRLVESSRKRDYVPTLRA